MRNYAKFMNDMFSKKSRLGEFETVALTEECIAMLMNKLPLKLKEPGSFTILCSIENHYVSKSLCDLGESINLIPISILKKLEIGKTRPTTIMLQLVDCSYAHAEDTDEYCYAIGIIDTIVKEELVEFCYNNCDNETDSVELNEEEVIEELSGLMEAKQMENGARRSFKSLNFLERSFKPPRPSIKDPPTLELKPLPLHLKYVYLGDNNMFLVVIFVKLKSD
ncbi:uncharacterized protein LOC105775492 [Gossypium raimondii]|uniref:uncharacterized protein LOC105775492 n=1 Tax=Gossypium raimondii TaxID=29730 RepID=UPI00063AA83C|nr:uncharacterized protein LOC105775492 [Gossypium raimondii]